MTVLAENVTAKAELASPLKQGMTDFKKAGYGGPCPPGGTHRYYFKVYALDARPSFTSPPTKDELLKSIEGHILAQGQLMGRYQR
jgi:Raf kinase inhibitor-like YbhB/YbcL family protein